MKQLYSLETALKLNSAGREASAMNLIDDSSGGDGFAGELRNFTMSRSRRCRRPARSPRPRSDRATTRLPALTADRKIHNAMRNRRPVQPLPSRVSDREFCPGGRDAGHAKTDTPIPVQPDLRLPATPAPQISNAPLMGCSPPALESLEAACCEAFPIPSGDRQSRKEWIGGAISVVLQTVMPAPWQCHWIRALRGCSR